MAVEIFRTHADQIMRAAADALPRECCGLLLGRGRRILALVPSPNVADDPARRFEIDPALLLATHRRVRAEGWQLLGSYHSHPTALLEPSSYDAAQATGEMPLYLISSSVALTAWQWSTCGKFEKMDLLILP